MHMEIKENTKSKKFGVSLIDTKGFVDQLFYTKPEWEKIIEVVEKQIEEDKQKKLENKRKAIPNCYKCKYRGDLVWDAHSKCTTNNAKVKGNKNGIQNGWFNHPNNFDPTWLVSCDGFESL